MALLDRLLHRFRRSDEDLLRDEVQKWAESVPGTIRIAECPRRRQVKVAGIVRRLTLRPQPGADTLEAVVSDGTGEVTAVWIGRNHIPGLSIGTALVLEGVMSTDREGPRMVNPRFEFA